MQIRIVAGKGIFRIHLGFEIFPINFQQGEMRFVQEVQAHEGKYEPEALREREGGKGEGRAGRRDLDAPDAESGSGATHASADNGAVSAGAFANTQREGHER